METLKAYQSFINTAEENNTVVAHTFQTGVLDNAFRQHLSNVPGVTLSANTKCQKHNSNPITGIVNTVEKMLKEEKIVRSELYDGLCQIFEYQSSVYFHANILRELRKRQFIAKHGLVISPDNCIASIKDVFRVRAFIRGIDRALKALRENKVDDRPLHIVYPACGPFAPLLLPLLVYYRENQLLSAKDIQVTLIDLQLGAVMSLSALIDELDLDDYVCEVLCQDAMVYQKSMPVDLVVLEAMQHGFSREGQMVMAKYFAELLEPEGYFIPQEVSVRAVLNTGQQEFVDQWESVDYCESALMHPQIQKQRVDLGEILSVTSESLQRIQVQAIDENNALIECGIVSIPHVLTQADQQLLLLCSRVRTFADDWVNEYDSGITHPLPDEQVCIDFVRSEPRPGDLTVNQGDCLKFYYRLYGLPGFFAVKHDEDRI